jgi:hypothetical protein
MNVEEFAGHTPGPWTVFENETSKVYGIECRTNRVTVARWFFEKPDAILAAAAPDLLAEVIKLRKLLVACHHTMRVWNTKEPKLVGDMDFTFMLGKISESVDVNGEWC